MDGLVVISKQGVAKTATPTPILERGQSVGYVTGLRCKGCGRDYPTEPINVCEFCFGPLEVVSDYQAISQVMTRATILQGPLTMWRYKPLLPIDGDNIIDIHGGFTPLIKAENLGALLGLEQLYLKNDSVNPTFSFKDRVVSVAVTKAKEFGFDTVACASTGNLAGSVAAHAAKAGMKAFVFIPAGLEQGKIIGAATYGPTLVSVDGTYDDVNRLCSELVDCYNWAFVNTNMRPYYAEGSKTLGYEVAEQLGWQAPDHTVIPSASGSLFTKIWKGLHEFRDLGLIDKVQTRMHMTQAAGCAPIAEAYCSGAQFIRPVKPNTIAKSLAIGNPADGIFALRTLKESHGSACVVPEEEVSQGVRLLAETEGIFTETAGGVVISGLRQLVQNGTIKRDEVTVAFITGNGLKTQEAVSDIMHPLNIKPTLASFQQALKAQ